MPNLPTKPAWWQTQRWLSSPECQYLCWLLADMKKPKPSSRVHLPSALICKQIACFLKPRPLMAAGCGDGHVHIMNADSGVTLLSAKLDGGCVFSVVYPPKGKKTLTVGCSEGSIHILDADSGAIRVDHPIGMNRRFGGGYGCCVSYAPDGQRLAIGCGLIRILDAGSGSVVATANLKDESAWSLAHSPNGQVLAAGSSAGNVYLLNAVNGISITRVAVGERFVNSVSYRPDGQTLAAVSDGRVHILNADDGCICSSTQLGDSDVWSVAYEPSGQRLAVGGDDGCVHVLSADSSSVVVSAQLEAKVRSLAFAPDGKSLAAGCADGQVRILDSDSGAEMSSVKVGDGNVMSVAYSS